MKTGLILEGGGLRGIYTAGILDLFMEQRLHFDGVIGVSAGAIYGCSFLSNQKGRSIRYYKKYCKDPRFIGLRSWITTGDIVGADFCYHEIPDKLDVYDHDAFLQCNTPFFAVCSNVETGKAEYIQLTDMRKHIEYLRASASLPYFSRIVTINGKKYLDGGCTDSVPVRAFQKMGYEKNVVILTREENYVKKPELNMLPKLFYHKYPAFAKAFLNRHKVYNHTMKYISKLEKEGKVFVIRPKHALKIGRLEKDPENVQRVYDIGYADGQKYMKNLLDWLNT